MSAAVNQSTMPVSREWIFARVGLATTSLLGLMIFLGYLAVFHLTQTNMGTAGATAITALLGTLINPAVQAGEPSSRFEVPRPVWAFLLVVAAALTVLCAVLILASTKYVNASAGLLAGIAAIGGLLVEPGAMMHKS
ncbi:MAG TPA: hypothetical protein VGM10_32220 [Actinocrinis sp.]|jgi:hypothetical protein